MYCNDLANWFCFPVYWYNGWKSPGNVGEFVANAPFFSSFYQYPTKIHVLLNFTKGLGAELCWKKWIFAKVYKSQQLHGVKRYRNCEQMLSNMRISLTCFAISCATVPEVVPEGSAMGLQNLLLNYVTIIVFIVNCAWVVDFPYLHLIFSVIINF